MPETELPAEEWLERLQARVRECMPELGGNPELLRGLSLIVAEELELALRRVCWKVPRGLRPPCGG